MSHANLERSMVQIFFTGIYRWQRALEFRMFVVDSSVVRDYDDKEAFDPSWVNVIEQELARRNGITNIWKYTRIDDITTNHEMTQAMAAHVNGRISGWLDDVVYAGNFPNAIVVHVLEEMYGKADGWDMRLYPEEVELWYAEK